MTRGQQIDYFRSCMLNTKREGMVDLLDYMTDLGFLDAPASGGNHLPQDGGLLEHTVNVMVFAEKIGVALLGGAAYNKIHNSVIIAAGLHDLGKCGRYGSQYYVENMIKDGKPTKKIQSRNINAQMLSHLKSIRICATSTTLCALLNWQHVILI